MAQASSQLFGMAFVYVNNVDEKQSKKEYGNSLSTISQCTFEFQIV